MSSKKYGKFGQKFLKGASGFRVSPEKSISAIEKYLSSLDCPRSLAVWMMFINNEHAQIADLEFDPLHYNSVGELRDAYAATKFFSKFSKLKLDRDLDLEALKKFSEFEDLCKLTNTRFKDLSRDPSYRGHVVWLHNAVIRKIDKILGEFSPEDFFSMPDWGPGASTVVRRRDASSAVKFQNETGITRDLYALISGRPFEVSYPHWDAFLKQRAEYPRFEVGNRVVTVPKDAKANRVIAIEPGFNCFFQKSVGDMIGSRLRRVGIDLRYQSVNQRFAKRGSRDQSIATVDMSSASDSISHAVVEALLPPRWFEVLDVCRCQYGTLNGRTVRWNKFSSMGNGFTFQLETLIFYAIAACCVEYQRSDLSLVSVYGDDIIIPTNTFDMFSEIVEFYGFRVNRKKSHFGSTFRESCGVHFFSGFDVTPIYLKDRLSTITSVYRFANAIRRYAARRMNYMACDSSLRPAFDHLVSITPRALRLRIPDTLGDGGFISNFDEAHPTRARHGIEGYRIQHLVDRGLTHDVDYTGYLLAEYWRLSKRDQKVGHESPSTLETTSIRRNDDAEGSGRNSVPLHGTRLAVARSVVDGWSHLGPWI